MKTLLYFLLAGYTGVAAYGNGIIRDYPENELLARPALQVTVGPRDADIVGNDNRALQAAVDYVGQLGGGVVEIGAGEYLMYDSLHLRSRVTLRGKGSETVLKKCASVRTPLAADGDYGECAITLENPDGFNVGYGVHIATKRMGGFHSICATILNKQGNYLSLSRPINADCMVADDAYAATVFPVVSAYHVQDFRIEKITIDGNREENEVINGCRGAGIFFYQGDAGIIENCTVRNFNGDGISYQQSNDVQVLNCVVDTCAGGGFHPGSGSQRTVVRGCTFRNNDGDGFFFCWRVRHATIEDNKFLNNGKTGITIGHKDSDNSIRRNLIENNAGGGVHWRNETEAMAAHNINFEENTVRNNGGYGLLIEGETNGTVIRNNTIEVEGKEGVGIVIGKKVGDVRLEANNIQAEEEVKDDREAGK